MVSVKQRLGQPFDHDCELLAMATSKRTLTVLVVALGATSTGVYAAAQSTHGHPAVGHKKSAVHRSTATTPGARLVQGKVVYPATLQGKIDSINSRLDACYVANGAPRVPIAEGGWTYNDPKSIALKACAALQKAANDLADSPEIITAQRALAPVLQQFWTCMDRNGFVPAEAHIQTDLGASALRQAVNSCSTEANIAG